MTVIAVVGIAVGADGGVRRSLLGVAGPVVREHRRYSFGPSCFVGKVTGFIVKFGGLIIKARANQVKLLT